MSCLYQLSIFASTCYLHNITRWLYNIYQFYHGFLRNTGGYSNFFCISSVFFWIHKKYQKIMSCIAYGTYITVKLLSYYIKNMFYRYVYWTPTALLITNNVTQVWNTAIVFWRNAWFLLAYPCKSLYNAIYWTT